jgi:membrane protein YfhO
MNKIKTSWIVLGLLSIICVVIFKDYLSLDKAYYFYDISNDGYYGLYPTFYNTADYIQKYGIPSWSFKEGMGQNLFPLIFHDPFFMFFYLFGKNNIIPLTIYLEVFKIILSGWLFYKYLKLMELSDYSAVLGSLFFAFCGFIMEGSVIFIFSFEALNFALLLYAFELLVKQKRWALFAFGVFLICISMPFNMVIYGGFIIFYAIFRQLQSGKFEFVPLRNLLLVMLGATSVGVLLSGPFLLQNIWMLLHNPRGADPLSLTRKLSSLPVFRLSDHLQLGTCIMRFFSNDILGSGEHFKGWNHHILEAPLFYCGLPCLLLLPQVFIFLQKRVRIVFIVTISVWLLPIVFPYFRYAFWLFAGDYYRAYSFFVAFIFIYYSVYAIQYIFQKREINIAVLLITLVILLTFLYGHPFIDNSIIDRPIQTFAAILLISYSIILIAVGRFKNIPYLKYVFFALILTEICYAGAITVNRHAALSISWLRDNKVLYNDYSYDAVKYVQSNDESFYRIDKYLEPNTSRYSALNFSQRQGYNSTASYSQFNQLYYIKYLELMGIVDKNKESESRWAIGLVDNPILESQNRVKYYLGQNNAHPIWPEMWDSVKQIGDVTVFRNKYVLPFGFGYNRYIRESSFNLASPRQKKFIVMQAFVVNDKDVDRVKKLREYTLSDTINSQLTFETFRTELDDLKKDTFAMSSFNESRFSGDVNLSEDKVIYFPVPYDDGWQLTVDISEVKPMIVNAGMIGIFMEKGKHHVDLFYQLRFIKKGLLMTLIGLILLIGLNWADMITTLKKMYATIDVS